jgi:aryl-alcohol dehydrogenase-like predicted oxidoreductase
MSTIDRREFLAGSAALVGAAVTGHAFAKPTTAPGSDSVVKRANDVVTLGRTGIKPSRLSMGTGSVGGSVQRKLGLDGLVKLLRHGHDNGVRWWDGADMYKTHPHIAATLKEIPRDQVVITSKTMSRDAAGVRADLERFRKELKTDYIDIVLLHCLTDANWREKMKGPMDVLSEAKQKGIIRAHGCSCHTLAALRAAADEPWVDIDLARLNPFAEKMDVERPEDVPKVVEVLKKMHERGKAVYAMKIVGEGAFKGDRIDESLRFVLSQSYVSGFTIGFANQDELDDMMKRMERIRLEA